MHAFDRQTEKQTDRQTDSFLLTRPTCIKCSKVLKQKVLTTLHGMQMQSSDEIWHWDSYWQVTSQTLSAVTQSGHCLHHLLPPRTSTYSSYQLRNATATLDFCAHRCHVSSELGIATGCKWRHNSIYRKVTTAMLSLPWSFFRHDHCRCHDGGNDGGNDRGTASRLTLPCISM